MTSLPRRPIATLLRYRREVRAGLDFLREVGPRLRRVAYGDRVPAEAEDVLISLPVVTALVDDVACLAFDEGFRSLGLTALT